MSVHTHAIGVWGLRTLHVRCLYVETRDRNIDWREGFIDYRLSTAPAAPGASEAGPESSRQDRSSIRGRVGSWVIDRHRAFHGNRSDRVGHRDFTMLADERKSAQDTHTHTHTQTRTLTRAPPPTQTPTHIVPKRLANEDVEAGHRTLYTTYR